VNCIGAAQKPGRRSDSAPALAAAPAICLRPRRAPARLGRGCGARSAAHFRAGPGAARRRAPPAPVGRPSTERFAASAWKRQCSRRRAWRYDTTRQRLRAAARRAGLRQQTQRRARRQAVLRCAPPRRSTTRSRGAPRGWHRRRHAATLTATQRRSPPQTSDRRA
jgi:hypothetical protein